MTEPTGSGIIAVCSCRARLLGRTFQISLAPKTQPLAPGGSAVYAVRTSGRAAGISLRLGALPAGVSGAFDRPVLRAGETARLTLTALSDAPPGLTTAFSQTTLEAGGGVVLTLSAERSARRGSFTIDVNGSSAAARVSFPIQVHVVDGGESPQPTGGCTSATAAWEAMIAAAAVALVSRRRRRLQPEAARR
jgi:hypothetical protein